MIKCCSQILLFLFLFATLVARFSVRFTSRLLLNYPQQLCFYPHFLHYQICLQFFTFPFIFFFKHFLPSTSSSFRSTCKNKKKQTKNFLPLFAFLLFFTSQFFLPSFHTTAGHTPFFKGNFDQFQFRPGRGKKKPPCPQSDTEKTLFVALGPLHLDRSSSRNSVSQKKNVKRRYE